jgi:hypothetical protein
MPKLNVSETNRNINTPFQFLHRQRGTESWNLSARLGDRPLSDSSRRRSPDSNEP